MTEIMESQQYIPGGETGPRDWKKRLRKAGVPDRLTGVIADMRQRVRDEAKAGVPIGMRYTVARAVENGEETVRTLCVLKVDGGDEKEGRSASASYEFDAPKDDAEAEDVARSFAQNVENCKRWLDAPLERGGGR